MNTETETKVKELLEPRPVVQANLVNRFRGTYKPAEDRTYYRNDGNKHIKSFGDKC